MTDAARTFGQSARLVLEDGTIFRGKSCGAAGTTSGEVVFNTSMTGYQEILTDPSYHGQIVTLTTAEVGVYGVNQEDIESGGLQIAGFVVRRLTHIPSNWRSQVDLPTALARAGIVAIDGVDTRALTRHLRVRGAMRGVLTTDPELTDSQLIEAARQGLGVVGQDFTVSVTCDATAGFEERLDAGRWYDVARVPVTIGEANSGPHVVLCDYGVKRNIARHLAERGCRVTIVPATTPADEILSHQPDGLLLSNGPGDPAACAAIVQEIRKLLGKLPIGGICLGHQLIALACGASTEKLPFGHRGANHPVRVMDSGRVLVTSQNHGFTVRRDSLRSADLELTHLSLNDGTVEGVRHRTLPVMSVQYHPEAAPGPHDAHDDFFDRFVGMVKSAGTVAAG